MRRVSECRGRWVLIRDRRDGPSILRVFANKCTKRHQHLVALSVVDAPRPYAARCTPLRDPCTNIERMPKFPANMIQILRTRRQEARRVRKRTESERSAKVKQREFRSIVFSSACNPVNIRSITLKYVSFAVKSRTRIIIYLFSRMFKRCASFSLHRHMFTMNKISEMQLNIT